MWSLYRGDIFSEHLLWSIFIYRMHFTPLIVHLHFKKCVTNGMVVANRTFAESTLELQSRAAPSVEAHQRSVGPDTGRNSGGKKVMTSIFK